MSIAPAAQPREFRLPLLDGGGSRANATVLQLPQQLVGTGLEPKKFRIYVDANGAVWTQIYVPVRAAAVNELKVLNDAGVIALDVQPLPETDFRAIEMAWLQMHHDEVQHAHAGEWIAVDGQQVVANAADLPTVLSLAAQAGHPHPFVTMVPAPEPYVPFYGWR